MTDETDVYLERCLKNWAERQKSHARSKESLLRLAAVQARMDGSPADYSHGYAEDFRNYRQASPYIGMYMRGSFTMSLGWTVDLSTLLRIAQ
jgi:hypothetical protein